MPSSHHQLSSCTNARLGPPFLPESATLTLQPSRFVNELMHAPMPPSHRQTYNANLLHPCMPATPLWCMTPFARSGSLPLWYVSCQKTATSVHQQWRGLLPHEMTPSWMQCQAHWHYLRCHNSQTAGSCQTSHFCATACNHQACTTAIASTCFTHNACNSKTTDTSCPQSCPCACAYVCNTQCSSCAAPETWPCLHCTQAPDPGTITALWPTRGEPWPRMSLDCLIVSYAHLGKGQ